MKIKTPVGYKKYKTPKEYNNATREGLVSHLGGGLSLHPLYGRVNPNALAPP
jgi:hypothetical protein